MKKSWLALVSALIVITVSLTFWSFWKSNGQTPTSKRSSSVRGPVAAANVIPKPESPVKQFIPGAPPTEAQIKQREARWARLFQTPIVIYGKVIDERGNPISGATVEIATVNGVQSAEKDRKTTDDGGLFSVVGKHGLGYSLRASKTGYYTIKQSTAHRNVLTPAKADSSNSTPKEPTILVLHSQGVAEALLVAKTGQIDVPRNGARVHIEVTGDRTVEGQLEIAAWIGNPNDSRFDWRFRIGIPGGGLKERLEQFDFEAPLDGYVSSVEYGMAASEQRWSADGKKEYFARLPDGRFARFAIRFYPSEHRNFVVVDSFVNPTPGHRNLEFNPTMTINPEK